MLNLETITISELEQKLYELAHECYKKDKEYIEADEIYSILDDNKKSYFACLVDESLGSSNAEKERNALQSPDWGKWIEEYQKARMTSRQARVNRDNLVRLYETCRSILSSRNTSKRTGI